MIHKIESYEQTKEVENAELTSSAFELLRSLTEIHVLHGAETLFINP